MAERSLELDQLATALSAAQAEFSAVTKDSENKFFSSKYAGLPAVIKQATPVLTKHGLSVSQFIGRDNGDDTLTTWLLHQSGQFISDSMRLPVSEQKGLTDAQAQGSATTYARRYGYMAALGLVAEEDDDGQAAPQRQKPAQQRQQPQGPKLASPQQQNLIRARARADGLSLGTIADAVWTVMGAKGDRPAWSDDELVDKLDRMLNRLPAVSVNPLLDVLKQLGADSATVPFEGADELPPEDPGSLIPE